MHRSLIVDTDFVFVGRNRSLFTLVHYVDKVGVLAALGALDDSSLMRLLPSHDDARCAVNVRAEKQDLLLAHRLQAD